ncbi:MAG: MATE family efflux transporter, partial [Rectinema sp.]
MESRISATDIYYLFIAIAEHRAILAVSLDSFFIKEYNLYNNHMHTVFLHQSTEQRRNLILNGSISSTLIFLAAPTLMLGVVQALMPLIDGLFINNIAGTLVASSVTFSEPVINMAVALAQGLSVAAMAIIGQLNGSGNFEESKRTSTQIVVMGSILGC